jgi:hypothetical protein
VLVDQGVSARVGTLFAVWGQPLASRRLAGFTGTVSAFVDGKRSSGPAGEIPLRRHSNIVLEIGPYVPAHRAYLFPPGT